MGLFSKFKEFQESRKQSRIEKSGKLVKNAKAIKEDRRAAIEFFSHLDDPEEATRYLLPRFEYSLEHGIIDTREKELAMEGVCRHGKAALGPVRDWISSTNRIAWPIKILKKIGSDDEIVEVLKTALNFDDVSFDQAAVDKNYDVLCYLRDYQLGGFADKVLHFMKDPDERVRFACVEVLIEQDIDGIQDLLEPLLADNSPDNIRILQSVVSLFIEKNWALKNPEVFDGRQVTEGVRVTKKGILTR